MRTECNRCKMPKMGGGMGMQGMHGMMSGMMPGMLPANMRPGDWMCPACNNHNYSNKTHCNMCQIPKEARIANSGMREGDWICTACSNHNYANKIDCNKCNVPKGDTASFASKPVGSSARREGEWVCASCNNNNYPTGQNATGASSRSLEECAVGLCGSSPS
ncbi:unnamed protein product [Polarella glacialis]|uniref:RanBP2-type domain-containing protein n=1 Tax=Polarella glacialis TaxID=89957 RepID=A0A813GXX2_POLGL|nr:unnamed protein product [Polarella glacialis]CAE8676715.1 unnamed protein product [Polarella glacialis]